jgi:hypothetical protein
LGRCTERPSGRNGACWRFWHCGAEFDARRGNSARGDGNASCEHRDPARGNCNSANDSSEPDYARFNIPQRNPEHHDSRFHNTRVYNPWVDHNTGKHFTVCKPEQSE